MTLVVTLFLALSGMVVSYAFGQGGPVAGLVFFAILLVGSLVKLTQPLRERLRP
jgi:prepilin signal peptidase PulO-like enzyme (type II secretory pathway)